MGHKGLKMAVKVNPVLCIDKMLAGLSMEHQHQWLQRESSRILLHKPASEGSWSFLCTGLRQIWICLAGRFVYIIYT